MKKLLLIFLLFFAAKSFAQYPAIQNLGNDSTLIRVGQNYKGGIKGGLINMSVTDTTAANLLRIKAYPGAQIYTDDGSVWIRNFTATGWSLLGGGVSPSGSFWAIGGNLFPVTVPSRNIGTLAPYGGAIGLMTNSVVHAIVPDAGFALSNDTTNTKVFTYNPTSKEWGYANWNNGGGGGATPTLQQVLTAGSTLTGSNSVDGGGFNFNFRQVDTLSTSSTIKEDTLTRYIMVTPNYASAFRVVDHGDAALTVDIGDVDDDGNSTNIALGDATGIIQLQARFGGVILDGGYTQILNLTNATTQDVLLGQTNIGDNVGYVTIGSGLSLSSGVLSASGGGGGTPAGNFGNLQINRNGAFATPGSDSLDFESATGLSVKGNVNVTGLINAADGSSGNPSITFTTSDNEGFWLNGTGNLVMANQNQNIWQTNTAAMRIKNTVQINFASGDPTSTGADIGIARDAAGVLRVTNGSTGVGDLLAKAATWSGRVLESQGTDVASANNLSLGTGGNTFVITGTTTINLISNTNWQDGSEITLVFAASLTVTNNAGTSGSNMNILLAGGANFSATANDVLKLVSVTVGGTRQWLEVSRSVN